MSVPQQTFRNAVIEEVAKSVESAPLTYAGPDPHVASDLRYLIVCAIRDLKRAVKETESEIASPKSRFIIVTLEDGTWRWDGQASWEKLSDECSSPSADTAILRLADRAARGSLNPNEVRDAAARLGAALLRTHSATTERSGLELLKEARQYLDIIGQPTMVVTKCDAEGLAKRIDDYIGERT